MSGYGIDLERRGNIALVVINRPKRHNAFDSRMFDELNRVTHELKQNLPRAVIITGAGDKAFSAGFDVNPDNQLAAELYAAMEKQDKPGGPGP